MEAKWFTSIDELSEIEWNNIFNNETLKSYAIFKAVEYSKMDDVRHYYLKIASDTATLAIIPCFSYKLDLCVLLDSKTQRKINNIRKFRKSFLFLNIFGVGSLIATCEQHFGFSSEISDEQFVELKQLVNKEIKKKIKETKDSIVFVKEVPANKLNHIKTILDSDFVFYYSLPNTFVPIGNEFQTYPKALVHRSQKRYTKFVDKFNELGLRWEIHKDFSDLTDTMFKLYLNVYHRSKNKFDKLNPDFFKEVNKLLHDNSYIVLSRMPSNEIASMMLIIEEKDELVPLYLGLNYDLPDYKTVYFNTLFKTISEAERKNKNVCVLGQTSYYPKILSGTVMQSLFLGFYSHKTIIKWCIKYLFKYLFPDTKPPCDYRYKNKKDLESWIKANGLLVEIQKKFYEDVA